MIGRRKLVDELSYESFRAAAQSLRIRFGHFKGETALRALFEVFKDGPSVGVAVWIEKITRLTNQVCAISVGNTHRGTGFLVGVDRVLTAEHVLLSAPANIDCSFNNITFTGNAPAVAQPIKVQVSDILRRSAATTAGHVADGHLDFALLQLQQAIGIEPRGFVRLQSIGLQREDKVSIVDHPDGEQDPVFDWGSVNARFDQSRDLIFVHTASADPGASGAPLFNKRFEIVGMHRAGQPATPNEAVYMPQIVKELEKPGI